MTAPRLHRSAGRSPPEAVSLPWDGLAAGSLLTTGLI